MWRIGLQKCWKTVNAIYTFSFKTAEEKEENILTFLLSSGLALRLLCIMKQSTYPETGESWLRYSFSKSRSDLEHHTRPGKSEKQIYPSFTTIKTDLSVHHSMVKCSYLEFFLKTTEMYFRNELWPIIPTVGILVSNTILWLSLVFVFNFTCTEKDMWPIVALGSIKI